jgi:CHASE3 domain sensor protein
MELGNIDWANLPTAISFGLLLIAALYLIWQIAKVSAQTQTAALSTGETAVVKAIGVLSDQIVEERSFHSKRYDILDDRVRELQSQLADRDRRIKDLEAENARLRNRIEELEKHETKPKATRKNAKKPINSGLGL